MRILWIIYFLCLPNILWANEQKEAIWQEHNVFKSEGEHDYMVLKVTFKGESFVGTFKGYGAWEECQGTFKNTPSKSFTIYSNPLYARMYDEYEVRYYNKTYNRIRSWTGVAYGYITVEKRHRDVLIKTTNFDWFCRNNPVNISASNPAIVDLPEKLTFQPFQYP